jgi:lysozyme
MQPKKSIPRPFQSLRPLGWVVVLVLLAFTNFSFTLPSLENNPESDSPYLFGIDVSHYQGKINWSALKNHSRSIHYVMIRATMGYNGIDSEFRENYQQAKNHGFLVGAYHYYRPNENSTRQFNHFSSQVKLKAGDMAPILDVERMGKYGVKNLRTGVLNWLRLAEKKYGKKPIIYTGRNFYNEVLKGHVNGYTLWIADYSGKDHVHTIDWAFHQFTDRAYINGIPSRVDGNNFKGTLDDLKALCL